MKIKRRFLPVFAASLVAGLLMLGGCTGMGGSVDEKGEAKPASYADVSFDHSAHEDYECTSCHSAKPEEGQKLTAGDYPTMKKCTTCHADAGDAPAECATCHSTIAEDKAPADHKVDWDKRHGASARFDNSCAWCHNETSCEDCHTTTAPMSHTPTWGRSGHGREADFDRRQCDTCHQADQCSRCHETKPFTHFGAGFRLGGHKELLERRGGSRSCRVCHEPDFCGVCHGG